MPDFDYAEFIGLATAILSGQDGTSQSRLRTAAGRAYYGVYGQLRKRIVTGYGDCFGGDGKHSALCTACRSLSPQNARILGEQLKNLLELRVRADYKWAEADTIEGPEAMQAVSTATAAMQRAASLGDSELGEIARRLRLTNAR